MSNTQLVETALLRSVSDRQDHLPSRRHRRVAYPSLNPRLLGLFSKLKEENLTSLNPVVQKEVWRLFNWRSQKYAHLIRIADDNAILKDFKAR